MSDLSLAGADAQSKTSAIETGFLSSLNSSLAGSSGLSSLFDKLLSDIKTSAVVKAVTATPNASTATVTTTGKKNTTTTSTANPNVTADGGANHVIAALRDVVENLKRLKKDGSKKDSGSVKASSQATANEDNANPGTDASTTGAITSAQLVVVPAPATPSPVITTGGTSTDVSDNAQGADSSTSQNTDPTQSTTGQQQLTSTQPSLDDLLAVLQQQLQIIRSQSSASSGQALGSTTDVSANTGLTTDQTFAATDAAANPINNDPALQQLDQMLDELQKLASALQQNTAPTTTDAATTAIVHQNAVASSNVPDVSTNNDALNSSIKNLLDVLKVNPVTVAAAQVSTPVKMAATRAPLIASSVDTKPVVDVFAPAAFASSDTTVKASQDSQKLLSTMPNVDALGAVSVTLTQTPATPVALPVSYSALLTAQVVASGGKDFDAPANHDAADQDTDNAGLFENSASGAVADSNATGAENIRPAGFSNFASQLTAAQSSGTNSAGAPATIDQVPFQLARAVRAGNDQMTLQLQPAELGRINIKLTIAHDGTVQGTVIADNPATLDMLKKDSHNLQQALHDAGLQADTGSLQFSLAGDSGNGARQTFEQAHQNTKANQNVPSDGTTTDSGDISTASDTWIITPGRVNLKV